MDRDAIDAEVREQAQDQRRERAEWCREKLGDLRNWLPLPVGEREKGKEATMTTDPIHATWKEFTPLPTDLAPPGYEPIECSVCGLRMGWTDEKGGLKMLCSACRYDLYADAPGRDD